MSIACPRSRKKGVRPCRSSILNRVVFLSEEDDGCYNVGVVRNKLMIEVHKSKEGAHSLDRGWGMPVFDGGEFCRVHVNKTLTNNHS